MSRHRYEVPTPYFQFPLELIGSVAVAALSLRARRVLDRLIIEHLENAGKHNGKLAVSYTQLAFHAGVHEKEIASGLAELVDLGLIVVAHGERPRGAAVTRPNFYRLTFLPDHEGVFPSEEWRRFEPSEGAGLIAWRTALARAKDVSHAARKRRFRSDEEAEAAVEPARIVLKRLGKDKRTGLPGNKQTRAALNEVNGRRIHFSGRDDSSGSHGTTHPVAGAAAHGTTHPVGQDGTTRPVPSIFGVHIAGRHDDAASTPDIDATATERRGVGPR